MLETLKTLKPWQAVVLVAVILGIAGGVYGIYDWAADSGGDSLPADTQLVPVQYGDLVNTVSASGSLVFPTSERLTFGSAGTVQEVNVEAGDTVREGEVLARLDSTSILSLQEAVTQAKIELRDAEEALEEARSPYTESDVADAEAAVTRAKVNLGDAEEALEEVQSPYTESDIADAEQAVERAQQQLSAAQARAPFDIADAEYALYQARRTYFDSLGSGEADTYLKQMERDAAKGAWERAELNLELARQNADNAVTDAEAALAQAEEDLAEMEASVDPLDVELKRREITSAQAALAQAEEDLAEMRASPDPLDVELKRREVATAQAVLDEALERLETATMVAPFGGIVAEANIEPGQTVSADTVVVEIVDPSVIEVSAIVDEIDVPGVREGQRATISLDSLPDLELSGEVRSVSAFANVQSGVVSYPVTIQLALPSGVQLREGMSATASIAVQAASNVLLIPNQAIAGSFSNPMVRVMVNGQPEERAVRLGTTDYMWTEVVEGLREGDMVLVEAASGTSAGLGEAIGRMMRGFGGGMIPGSGGGEIHFDRGR